MRNLKKALALLVVVTMLTISMMPVFATGFTYEEQATKLHNLGLLDGVSTGEFDPGLDITLDRQTGTALLVKVFGKKDLAEAMEADDVNSILNGKFKDVEDIASWAKPYVAFAVQQKMVEGYPDGTFKGETGLNGKALCTMILRQLGYTVTGNDYQEAAFIMQEKGGLTEAQATAFNTNDTLNRDGMVGIAFGSLSAVNTEGNTLIKALVDAGIVDKQKATDAGFVVKTIKSVASPANVTVEINKTPTLPEKVTATFDDDTTGEVAVVWGTVDTTTAGTKTVTGTIAGFEAGVTMSVVVTPAGIQVTKVEATNLKEVVVTFNQPMSEASALDPTRYVFSGFAAGALNAAAVYAEFANTEKTAVRLLTAGVASTDCMATTDTSAKLTITGVYNESGTLSYTSSTDKESVGAVTADGTAPTVVEVKPIGTQHFQIVFSEPVIGSASGTANTALNEGAYKIGTNQLAAAGLTQVTVTNPSKDLRTFNYTFPTTATTVVPLVGDLVVWVNNHSTTNDKIRDFGANNVPITSKTVTFNEDLTRPTVKNVSYKDRQTLRVTFEEAINTSSFTLSTVKWGTGTYAQATKAASSITYISGTTYDLGFAVANALPTTGTYKLFIPKEQVVDLSGNVMLVDYEKELTGVASNPNVISATGTTSTAVLTFSRNIADDSTITNTANYKIDGAALASGAVVTRTSDTVVTISSITLSHGTHTVSITGLKDTFSDVIADTSASFSVTDTVAPTIAKMYAWNDATTTNGTNRDLVLVVFDKTMKEASLTTAANYKINYGTAAADLPSGTVITAQASNKAVLLDIPGTSNTFAAGTAMTFGRISSATFYGLVDLADNPLAAVDWVTDITTVSGTRPASMITTALNINTDLAASNPVIAAHNRITMKVAAANVNMFGAVNAANFTVRKGTGTSGDAISISSVTPTDTDADGFYETLTFMFADNTFTAGDLANVAISTALTSVDRFGVALQTANVDVAKNDIAAKIKGAAVMSSTEIVVVTDKDMGPLQGTNMSNALQVFQGGTQKLISGAAVQAANNRKFTITLSNPVDVGQEVTVKTISQSSINAIDADSLYLTANTTGIRADGMAPSNVVFGNLSGTALQSTSTLAITFNRAVDTTSIKSGWDGTTATAVTVSAGDTTELLTIPGVGTVAVDSITTGGTMTSATMIYNSGTKTLTVTFTNIGSVVAPTCSNLIYTPATTLKDGDGAAVNSNYIFVE